MLEKLRAIEKKYKELSEKLADPNIFSDQEKYKEIAKSHSDLSETVGKYEEYKMIMARIEEANEMLEDELEADFREFVEMELAENEENLERLDSELKLLLIPKDPRDKKNVIMEIRAGTGGDEAALFANDLFRMYSRYAERKGWKVELMNASESEIGGFKEVIFSIEGHGAYSRLKYESGVHRVQRVPVTESGGRIHTSTSTVAVLPEAEEVEVEISADELRVDVYRSTGHGGQSVNTTDSAVRITHLPTGLVVTCQDEKSQLKNKTKAMRILRARLLDIAEEEKRAKIHKERRSQVGTGDRSERIRTYNFPQNRVTDHRLGLTLHKLDIILDGELDEFINSLITNDQIQKLKGLD